MVGGVFDLVSVYWKCFGGRCILVAKSGVGMRILGIPASVDSSNNARSSNGPCHLRVRGLLESPRQR